MLENPIAQKTLWILGLAGGAFAVGAVVWAGTAKAATANATAASSTAVKAAVQSVILNLSEQDLCTKGNSTVLAFQQAWNAAGGSPLATDGVYDGATAGAAYQVDPSAPTACNAGSV